MSNSANLPAPYSGQDSELPTAALQSPYCERLFNFNTTPVGISLRNGDSKWIEKAINTTGGTTIEYFRGFVPFGTTSLFMAVTPGDGASTYLRYYDITTQNSTPTLAYTSTTISGSAEVFTTQFGGRVFIFAVGGGCDYFDGSSWGASTYSFPGSHVPLGGCAYKNRQYFIFKNSASYGYSGVDLVSGTVTEVPLAGVISEDADLWVIAPLTVSNEVSSQQLLAFVFTSGEVLFYSGSYPDSASWGLVGSGNIDTPININSALSPYRGDALVATRSGLYSLRDLFLRGSQDAVNLVTSRPVTSEWIDQVTGSLGTRGGITTARVSGGSVLWWKKEQRVIVSIADSSGFFDTPLMYFVLDVIRGAWAVHESFGVSSVSTAFSSVVMFQGRPLFCGTAASDSTVDLMISEKEGASDFQDVQQTGTSPTKVNYDFEMLSAPIPFPKTAVYEATQIEPILESDLYAETNYNLVVDFGRQTSGDQKTDAATTSVAKPAANVGMQNITYVQVKISGTTAAGKSVGLDLYSYNVWYNSGETGSR